MCGCVDASLTPDPLCTCVHTLFIVLKVGLPAAFPLFSSYFYRMQIARE